MIIDKELMMSNAQAVTATAASTGVIDLGARLGLENGGLSDDLWLQIRVDTAAAASGSATVAFAFETDDDEAFGTATTLWSRAATGKALLVAGYSVARFKLPIGMKRYARVYYTVATGPLTAGKFDAFINSGVQESY